MTMDEFNKFLTRTRIHMKSAIENMKHANSYSEEKDYEKAHIMALSAKGNMYFAQQAWNEIKL